MRILFISDPFGVAQDKLRASYFGFPAHGGQIGFVDETSLIGVTLASHVVDQPRPDLSIVQAADVMRKIVCDNQLRFTRIGIGDGDADEQPEMNENAQIETTHGIRSATGGCVQT